MKTTLILIFPAVLFLTGCEHINDPYEPPSAPTGLRTSTGDNFIELFWNPNPERDIAGYTIYVSSSYNGRYTQVGTSQEPYFIDRGAINGVYYYYAVTAYDFDGNESPMSTDVAYDVPRPEGYNVVLGEYHVSPATAGYSFASYSVVAYNSNASDMFFDNYNGYLYMDVFTDTDIQDLGPTSSILDISEAPAEGWSPDHSVLLQPGHTYVVWTVDDHYAKFRVSAISQNRVVFDWAYQLIPSTPLLKHGTTNRGSRTAMLAVPAH
jgi:hypothetical protein